ncbi:MAG: hypothetical protein JO157_10700 [Acetobacteraceae bacterium]|nr:hypothetical protein [Acetobacteraceae bacterium]
MSEDPEHSAANAKIEALTPRERARLAGILARLASSFESERAAAGLLASAFVEKHGLTWADLTSILQPIPESPTPSKEPRPRQDRRAGSKGWRGFCRRRLVRLGQALDRLS